MSYNGTRLYPTTPKSQDAARLICYRHTPELPNDERSIKLREIATPLLDKTMQTVYEQVEGIGTEPRLSQSIIGRFAIRARSQWQAYVANAAQHTYVPERSAVNAARNAVRSAQEEITHELWVAAKDLGLPNPLEAATAHGYLYAPPEYNAPDNQHQTLWRPNEMFRNPAVEN